MVRFGTQLVRKSSKHWLLFTSEMHRLLSLSLIWVLKTLTNKSSIGKNSWIKMLPKIYRLQLLAINWTYYLNLNNRRKSNLLNTNVVVLRLAKISSICLIRSPKCCQTQESPSSHLKGLSSRSLLKTKWMLVKTNVDTISSYILFYIIILYFINQYHTFF